MKILHDIKDSINKLKQKITVHPLDLVKPQVAIDILAAHHILAWIINIGCLIAVIFNLLSITVILFAFSINLAIAWGIYASKFGCPLSPVENLYRRKAGQENMKMGLDYIRNLVIRVVGRIRGN